MVRFFSKFVQVLFDRFVIMNDNNVSMKCVLILFYKMCFIVAPFHTILEEVLTVPVAKDFTVDQQLETDLVTRVQVSHSTQCSSYCILLFF